MSHIFTTLYAGFISLETSKGRRFRFCVIIRYAMDSRMRWRQLPQASKYGSKLKCMPSYPKSVLGNAICYTINNWDALCRYTEQGFLDADS